MKWVDPTPRFGARTTKAARDRSRTAFGTTQTRAGRVKTRTATHSEVNHIPPMPLGWGAPDHLPTRAGCRHICASSTTPCSRCPPPQDARAATPLVRAQAIHAGRILRRMNTAISPSQVSVLNPRLLSAHDVAAMLGVSPRWVYRKALEGELPFAHLSDSPRSPLRAEVVP